MTKLISGRVKKIPSANVSASRYEFIKLSETEPDLGLPAGNGYVLTANVNGTRAWVLPLSNIQLNSINELSDVDTATTAPSLGFGLVWNGSNWVPNAITVSATEYSNIANVVLNIVQASLVANTAFFAANSNLANIALTANVANTVLSLSNFTTSNLIEGVNLYYTNTRVYANVIGLLNAKANVVDLTTANVTESASNLYYTNARVYANVIGLLNAKANVVDLTTANVTESAGNLYFTNARVISAVTPYLTTSNVVEGANLYYTNARVRSTLSSGTGVSYDTTTGQISIGQNVDTHANVTFNEMTITGNLNVVGNVVGVYANTLIVNDPLIQLGYNNPSDGLDLGFIGHYSDTGTERHAGLFRDASDKNFKFFDNFTGEPGVAVIDTANATFRLANVVASTFIGNVVGNVNGFVSSIGNFSTSDLVEGNNLYYTNSRVISAVTPYLTTANVVESASNLYYTVTRANAAIDNRVTKAFVENLGITVGTASFAETSNVANTVTTISNFTTSNLAEGTNLYYTNARVRSAISAGDSTIIYDPATGQIRATANITATLQATVNNLSTSNVSEGSNLYYTNARVSSNIIALLPTLAGENIVIAANGQISATTSANLTVTSSSILGLNTANVTESASNLYYTNARVYSNVVSLLSTFTGNITAGNITTTTLIANSIIGTAVGGFITGANLISTNNISSLNWIGLYTANVVESASNLYYTNARVYSNVIGFLPSLAGTGIAIDANGVISASLGGVVTANTIVGLNTANVAESTSNLYYTNARVYANVIGLLNNKANVVDLTTANVIESASNLYFTNTRVYANVALMLPTYTGNMNAGNITTTTLIANSIIGTAVGGYIIGANLISTNNISSLNWIGIYTANVIESASNLYYTNSRVYSNVIGFLPSLAGTGIAISANGVISASLGGVVTANTIVGLNTANVAESDSNLYYTNARVYANVIGLLNAKANVVDLTTANVAESTSNLYYTNARVYGNVIALLPTYTGNVNAGNITTTTLIANSIIGTAVGGFITGANLISTNNISSLNWIGIYTANVIESASNLYYTNARVISNVIALLPTLAGTGIAIDANGIISSSGGVVIANTIVGLNTANVEESASNLYYTNARVYANVIGLLNAKANVVDLLYKANVVDLTTANVNEFGSNLYYTNARVYSNVSSLLSTFTGDITAGNITTSIIIANSIVGTAVGGSITGANLISTNNIVSLNWIGLYTSNVIETANNLYYTNTRVRANVIALLPTLAGTGIAIDANGVISASLGGVVTANTIVGLTTANVTESASNLYYTNARAILNVIPAVTELLVTAPGMYYSIDQYTGNNPALDVRAGETIAFGLNSPGHPFMIRVSAGGSNYDTGLTHVANDGTISTGSSAQGKISGRLFWKIPYSLAGNTYVYQCSIHGGMVGSIVIQKSVSTITTSDIAEGANLYYTNTRVYSNVASMLSGYTGNINAGNITTSILIANSIVGTALGGSITGANLISTNNISSFNWIGLYTANVIESASNLYYTNARVFAALSSGTGVNYSNTTGVISIGQNVSPNASVTFANLIVTGFASFYGNVTTFSSNNLSISDNMIYLNNGSESSNPDLGFAGNYNDGSYKHTGFFRDATDGVWKVYDSYTPEPDASQFIDTAHASFRLANLAATTFTGNVIGNVTGFVSSIGNFTTSNLAEGTNLYYTNARVAANVVTLLQGNVTMGNIIGNVTVTNYLIANGLVIRGINVTDTVLAGNVTAGTSTSDTVTANTITANVWNNLYTANVIETAGNLYYTNARVRSNVIGFLPSLAGTGILINANGVISASSSDPTQLTVSSSQTLTGGNQNYTLSSSVTNANSIIVSINGLVQAPAIDYTLNGGQGLQFSANTTANALIEVKYYGYSALSPNVAVVSSSVTIPTVAGQAAYMMGANVTQAQSIMVALDGLIQRPTVDYTVNNTTITMIPAPPEGSNIEIRFFGQEAVALAGAQYTTAYISNSRTYAGGSANLDLGSNVLLARNIIVNIDGVTQIPDLNYTVSGNTLSFGTSVPAVGSLVEVKFFGAEAFNANLTQAMITAVLPTVLSNDTLVRQIVRSSAYAFSRIFY